MHANINKSFFIELFPLVRCFWTLPQLIVFKPKIINFCLIRYMTSIFNCIPLR